MSPTEAQRRECGHRGRVQAIVSTHKLQLPAPPGDEEVGGRFYQVSGRTVNRTADGTGWRSGDPIVIEKSPLPPPIGGVPKRVNARSPARTKVLRTLPLRDKNC